MEEANVFCAFFLAKKRRNCKMRVKRGAVYCAEHLTAAVGTECTASEAVEDRRVPCPLDPAHSVYESRLKAHLKKCNAAIPETPPPYFSKDLNIIFSKEEGAEADENTVKPAISEMVRRIEKASNIDSVICERRRMSKSIEDFSISEREKHRLQQKALSDLILEKISSETAKKYEKVVIVEFGAGKGGLSSFLWESRFQSEMSEIRSEFVLIDRSNSRCKKDAKMRHTGADLKRIFIDIKDLDLSSLFAEYDRGKTYFLWVSKHLCGAATCLTINALNNLTFKLDGTFCVALCCHQCCSSKSYPNPGFLIENGLIKDGESFEKSFKTLLSISSWAVCGFRGFDDEREGESEVESEIESEVERIESDGKRIKIEHFDSDDEAYSPEYKESVGRKAKRLLDYGRFLKLKESFGECALKHYIEEEVTLENAVLLGHMKC